MTVADITTDITPDAADLIGARRLQSRGEPKVCFTHEEADLIEAALVAGKLALAAAARTPPKPAP